MTYIDSTSIYLLFVFFLETQRKIQIILSKTQLHLSFAQRIVLPSFHSMMHLLLFYTGLCGGIYNATSTSVTATSPNFPNEYPPFTLCTWVIDAPPQEQVRVVVETFHLHSSQDCSQNYLELQDSPTVRNFQGIPFPIPIQLPSLFEKREETYCLVMYSLMILCEGHIQSITDCAPSDRW